MAATSQSGESMAAQIATNAAGDGEPTKADREFGAGLEKIAGQIFALAFRLGNDAERARDLTQDSLLAAWEKRDQLATPERLLSWARKICINLFLMEERRLSGLAPLSLEELGGLEAEGRGLDIPDEGPLPPELAEVNEGIREIRDICFAAMVHRLGLNQRVVFALVETFGLSIGEAAEAAGFSLAAAKALLGRARRHILNYFETNCDLMNRDNPCDCLIWKGIANDRILLREEARRRGLEADFGDDRLPAAEAKVHAARIIAMFRQLPPRRPDPAWFEAIISRLPRTPS
ncbi:MAG TPA: RNA polymerase sigma factor [Rectinemataceae bacterium]|nr:RNA polymerase sigma factor [Rectinemataceae bacterium]